MERYNNLANAIVVQAADDYSRYLCKEKELVEALEKIRCEIKDVENFFTGDDIKIYTKLDGPTLMKKLKERVEYYNYNYTRIKQSKTIKYVEH